MDGVRCLAMVWALLAILGVPIWLIVGILLAIVLQRRNFKKQPGVFPCVIRDEGATKWPRSQSFARQVRSVFVVNRGAALLRTEIHGVAEIHDLALGDNGPKKPAGPVGRLLTLDDGSRLEVAVPNSHLDRLESLTKA